jgi:hypothetical protein
MQPKTKEANMPTKTKAKKPAGKKPKKQRFELVIDGQRMLVDYEPNWMVDMGHMEFRSPHTPARRIPVSETGYRSHFGAMEEIEAEATPQDYARLAALAIIRQKAIRRVEQEESDQLTLF